MATFEREEEKNYVTLFVLIPARYLVPQLVSRPRQTFIHHVVTPQMRYQSEVHHHAMFITFIFCLCLSGKHTLDHAKGTLVTKELGRRWREEGRKAAVSARSAAGVSGCRCDTRAR